MRQLLTVIIIFLSLPLQASQHGYSFKSALQKQNMGYFQQSLQEASKLKTADGYALAARARLILVRFYIKKEKRLTHTELALADALKALEIDERHLEGNLQAAVAWGFKARIRKQSEDARRAKFYIDQALLYHPDSPWAWAANGGWHAEVVEEAGILLGRILLGASRKTSITSFKKAIGLSQNPIPFYLAYSQSLFRSGKKKYHDEAYNMLQKMIALPPQNYLDQISQKFAIQMLQAIENKDTEQLNVLLGDFARPM